VAELFEHVEIFSSNFSAVDVVENLKEDEGVENDSQSFLFELCCNLNLLRFTCIFDINSSNVSLVSDHRDEFSYHNHNVPE